MPNPIIVIYHRADFDGIFSREVCVRRFGDTAKYIGWDYKDPLPDIPKPNEDGSPAVDLIMVDISVDGLMDYPGLVWIDHHKSAIAKFGEKIAGFQLDGVAACRLAWQYFNPPTGGKMPAKEEFVGRQVNEPLAIQLAGEYDIFDHRDPRAALFQHGLRSQEVDFQRLLHRQGTGADNYVAELLAAGTALQYARTKENAGIIRDFGFTVEFEGLKFLACNAARYNSFLFVDGIRPEHDGLLGFNYDGHGMFRVSMYGVPGKPDIDFSVIAVKHGGGGHKQACGFKTAKLPFLP